MWAFFPNQLEFILELMNSWTDKTPQIAEEQLVMTMDKAQETADISKSEEISRWRPIDKTLHYDFSANNFFFKNRHNFLSEGLTFFPAMGSKRSETKHCRRLQKPFQLIS